MKNLKYWIQDHKPILYSVGAIIAIVILWNLLAYRDINYIKREGSKYLNDRGFVVINDVGYTGGLIYGGSQFFMVYRKEQPKLFYEIELVEWRGEIQSYVPIPVNNLSISIDK